MCSCVQGSHTASCYLLTFLLAIDGSSSPIYAALSIIFPPRALHMGPGFLPTYSSKRFATGHERYWFSSAHMLSKLCALLRIYQWLSLWALNFPEFHDDDNQGASTQVVLNGVMIVALELAKSHSQRATLRCFVLCACYF